MMDHQQILPACGEGDREAVEGARVLAPRRRATTAPSVSGFAAATSPRVGRI